MSVPLPELERRCQKPDHRRIGNWMARRVTRPLALRVTRVVAPLGVSAHAMTLLAWAAGVAAAAAFGGGTIASWLAGAALLQLWYLLDHVDGQLARYHGTASLDGVQLDYLMHHTINLLLPIGVGWGFCAAGQAPWWLAAGLGWGCGLLLLGLLNDTRHKAFLARLKTVQGTLEAVGGGGGRPAPQPPIPRTPVRRAAWLARKSCEIHVTMNALSALAVAAWLFDDAALFAGRAYLAVMAPLSLMLAAAVLARSVARGDAEREFAAWFRVPAGATLEFREGTWHIQAGDEEDAARPPGGLLARHSGRIDP